MTKTKKTCSVEGCDNQHLARGYCGTHYNSWRFSQPDVRRCSVDDCSRPHVARGLCGNHYELMRRNGSPERIIRAKGSGTVSKDGYLRVMVDGKSHLKHRYVMALHLGRELLPSETVHHLNGDRLDNRIENLELWSTDQPPGQRVIDKVEYALEILRTYAPEHLNSEVRA